MQNTTGSIIQYISNKVVVDGHTQTYEKRMKERKEKRNKNKIADDAFCTYIQKLRTH